MKNEELHNLQSVLTDVIQLLNCALEVSHSLISADEFHSFAIMIHMVYYFPSFIEQSVEFEPLQSRQSQCRVYWRRCRLCACVSS